MRSRTPQRAGGISGPAVLVGVDAGASKSVALAIREDGTRVGRADGPGANPKRHGLPVAATRIADLAGRASGARAPDLVLVAGAGIDRPEHARALERALTRELRGGSVQVVNDTLAALRAGTPEGVGLAIPVSTGGNVLGRGADGRVTDRGHGIFGGGYVLGALAARAARRGRVSPGLAAVIGAAALEWRGRRPGPEAAALGAAVIDAAAAGDPYPARMVDRWCGRIAACVREEADRLGLGPRPAVVIYGGLLEASAWLEEQVRDAILAGAPRARIVRLAMEPVEGAVLLAHEAWVGTLPPWQFEPRR